MLCYFVVVSICLKTGELKPESKLCLWGSPSRTAFCNRRKSICRLFRPRVSLWIQGLIWNLLGNVSKKIYLCGKFCSALELSASLWLSVLWELFGLSHLNTHCWSPEAVPNATERREDRDISSLMGGCNTVLTGSLFNKSLYIEYTCFVSGWACKRILTVKTQT